MNKNLIHNDTPHDLTITFEWVKLPFGLKISFNTPTPTQIAQDAPQA